MYKLEIKDKSVVFGEHVWNSFQYIKTTKDVLNNFRNELNIKTLDDFLKEKGEKIDNYKVVQEYYKLYYTKYAFLAFTDKYKVAPSKFRQIFNAMMMNIWCVQPYFSRYCFTSRGIIERKVELLHMHLDLIRQTEKDNQSNIIPFVLYTGMNSQQLRGILGRGLWRKICKNSHNKNHLIAKKLNYNPFFFPDPRYPQSDSKRKKMNEEFKKFVEDQNKLSSSILKHTNFHDIEILLAIDNCFKSKDLKQALGGFSNTVADTIRMAKQLNENYNLNWSENKWKQKHEEYSEILTSRQYSKEKFSKLDEYKDHIIDDYECVLLRSPFEIAQEGLKMGHCVASYINRVEKNSYLVYSVRKNGEKISTLGLSKNSPTPFDLMLEVDRGGNAVLKSKWKLDQHYRKYNNSVGEEKLVEEKIIDSLNK